MKKSLEELQAKNQEIATRYDNLVAYTDQQVELLRDTCKRNFSEILQKLDDEGNRIKTTKEFQVMVNETLQCVIRLVTRSFRPADGSPPSQMNELQGHLDQAFNTYADYPAQKSVTDPSG
jgi:hypothetical protein